MLPRKRRIKREIFGNIVNKSSTFESPYFSVRYLKNNQEKALFSCVISKKGEKTSVGRHKVKRQVYEILSLFLKEFSQKGGYSVILYVRKSFIPLPFVQKKEVLLEVFRKIRIIA